MKIFSLNKTGQLHETHTEDHFFVRKIEFDWVIGAVMDGCSSGKETYFVSTLYGKILQKACSMLLHFSRINPDFNMNKIDAAFIGTFLLNQVFVDLARVHKLLATELIEILSTLLLLVYDNKNKSAWINISGDGLFVHNGKVSEIDQDNVPDYMAYHLDISFDQWIQQFSKTYTFDDLSDVSISTDGITKFFSLSLKRPKPIDPVHYFLIDDSYNESVTMLEEKYRILKDEYGLIPYDDLGMIRIINR
jgi:hypothetical protein